MVGKKGKKAVGIKKQKKHLVGKKAAVTKKPASEKKPTEKKPHRGKEGCCITLYLLIT